MRFVGIQSTEKPDAPGIVHAIDIMCTAYLGQDLDTLATKLVGFGSDGASVMMGKKSGVQQRLGEKQKELLVVHCMAHHLELAFFCGHPVYCVNIPIMSAIGDRKVALLFCDVVGLSLFRQQI